MIRAVNGKPGAGKGRYFAEKIVACLTQTTSCVVSAFAIRVEPWVNGHGHPMIGLREYLIQRFSRDFDVTKRYFELDDEQGKEFYLWRVSAAGILFRIDATSSETKDGMNRIETFNFQQAVDSQQVEYFIDEAGLFFGSREWKDTGRGMLSYISQHRHIGDEVFMASQSHKDVDVAMVRKFQDFAICRNRSLLRIGIFRQPDDFKVHIYENPPTGGLTQMPMMTETFGRDKKILQTFDTTAGVGHRTGRARGDLMRKRTGLNWKWFWIGCICVPLVVGVFADIFLKKGTKVAQSFVKLPPKGSSLNVSQSQTFSNLIMSPSRNFHPIGLSNDNKTNVNYEDNNLTNQIVLECSGYSFIGTNVFVCLSDGSEYSSIDGEVDYIRHRTVSVLGKVYKIRRNLRGIGNLDLLPIENENPVQSLMFSEPDNNLPTSTVGNSVILLSDGLNSPIHQSGIQQNHGSSGLQTQGQSSGSQVFQLGGNQTLR